MKTILFSFALLITYIGAKAQVAATVYDPTNNSELISMSATLVAMKQQGAEVVKTLESANQIRSAAKITELIAAIEDSFCIIQDLHYFNLQAKILFKLERTCFDNFMYSLCVTAINNAMSQTTMAATSVNMTLGERSNTISQSFSSIKSSNEDLNEMKEKLKKKVEGRENMGITMNALNKLF